MKKHLALITILALVALFCGFKNAAADDTSGASLEQALTPEASAATTDTPAVTPEPSSETVKATAEAPKEPAVTSEQTEPEKTSCLAGMEFLTGFGWGKMRTRNNYNLIPLRADFDFDLKPLLKKINLTFRPLCQFQLEPFISPISSPKSDVEIGTAFMLKTGLLPDTAKLQPYVKAGVGMVYMTLHTREQGTQFNFIEQGGLGMHYYFLKNTALTLEGYFRHLSNAGMRSPNSGINTYFVFTGISYKY